MAKKLNILIIGNPDSIWIKKYIEKVIRPLGFNNIYVVDIGLHKKGTFSNYYDDNCINMIQLKKSKIHKMPLIGSILYIGYVARCINKEFKTDIIHVHFVNWQSLFLMKKIKVENCRTVVSYWGSDILRENEIKLKLAGLWLGKADRITLTTAEMRRAFKRVYGTKFDGKIFAPFFGVNCFDVLKQMDYKSELYKSEYNIDSTFVTITIGYNGSEAQQHLQALDAIERLNQDVLKNVFIIIPMTYGVTSNNYIESVNTKLRQMKIAGFKILTDYMNEEESSKLKCVTDIFIHAQITDAFSASVQEFLYAEKIVLNPQWIKYDEHEKMGVFYLKYDDFNSLSKVVNDAINYYKEGTLKKRLKENKKILQNTTSWEAVAPEWRSLYE